MDELLQFLKDNDIEPDKNKNQVVAFEDAVIYLTVDADDVVCIQVELLDAVHYFHDVKMEHFLDLDEVIEEILDDEDWEDEYDEDFEIEQEIIRQEAEKALIKELLKDTVDGLLDKYNIAMDMYNEFGDEEYKKRAEQILEDLKKTKLE